MGMRENLELHIDELILHGFPQGDLHRIGSAVENELARLLEESGIPESLTTRGGAENIDAGAFEVSGNSMPDAVGSQVARAVYRGLSK